jgi:hypothetical protein
MSKRKPSRRAARALAPVVTDYSSLQAARQKVIHDKVPLSEVLTQMQSPGRGFERVELIEGSTYKDSSTVIVIPTRGKYKMVVKDEKGAEKDVVVEGLIDKRVVSAWQALISPMNQKRAMLFTSGHEVGQAYDAMIQTILAHPELKNWKYVMTLEDDNIPPPDAQLRLLESIEKFGYDAVSGLYFTKGEISMPMAYGDPAEYQRTGVLDFRPRDVREALAAGQIMPVNGIAMGCALWRMSLFREIPSPWYVTLNDFIPNKGTVGMTQDLSFCRKAREAGKRFATDMRVKVGHLDVSNGTVY